MSSPHKTAYIIFAAPAGVHKLLGKDHMQTKQLTSAGHGRAEQRNTAAQHSTAQHSTAQHSTAQHGTAQHSTARHSTAQHSTDLDDLGFSKQLVSRRQAWWMHYVEVCLQISPWQVARLAPYFSNLKTAQVVKAGPT